MARIITANANGNHTQGGIFQMAILNGLSIITKNQGMLNAHIEHKLNEIEITMNRKKKINQSLKKRIKQTNAKLHTSNKPKYISKAERAKIAQEQGNDINSDDDQTEAQG
tara:strand:- start:475 stop:804 length:330 start_codon:yes stop_codon:yes gene_type:complete